MNDTTTNENEAAEEAGPVGGERLRVARRENDISVAEIAKELHLDVPKVRALERNDFDVLGAPVFAKGHLRKYAGLVGVSTDDVMTDYYQMTRSAGAPPVVGPKRKHMREVSLVPWIRGGVAVIIVAAAAFWWFVREPAAPVSDIEPATLAPFTSSEESPSTVADELLPATAAPERDDDTDVISVEQAVVAEFVPIITDPDSGPVSLEPQVRMELTFSGDCWTEVSDGSGRQLYYDLGQAGRVISLSGDSPLHVILGDSANVSITVDGRDYPIPASARSGRLARLDINSQ